MLTNTPEFGAEEAGYYAWCNRFTLCPYIQDDQERKRSLIGKDYDEALEAFLMLSWAHPGLAERFERGWNRIGSQKSAKVDIQC